MTDLAKPTNTAIMIGKYVKNYYLLIKYNIIYSNWVN